VPAAVGDGDGQTRRERRDAPTQSTCPMASGCSTENTHSSAAPPRPRRRRPTATGRRWPASSLRARQHDAACDRGSARAPFTDE
jgi:hypothetical protein